MPDAGGLRRGGPGQRQRPALAEALPDATYAEVPGNHMSCVTRPDLSEAMVEFLG